MSPAGARPPVLELLARYGAVLRAAWAARHELAGPRRLADEAAFLPAALSLQETPVHPAPRRTALAICALFGIALLWAVLGEIDIVAVAPGRIVVGERTKLLQPLERSVVRRILVGDGDRVEQGQVLVELDATAANADQSSVEEQLRAARSEAVRSEALLAALGSSPRPPRLAPGALPADEAQAAEGLLHAEWADISSRLSKLDAERVHREAEVATVQASLDKLQATLPMARQREADFRTLADQGFVAAHANQDRTRERVEMERDLAMQQARLQETRAALAESIQGRAVLLTETRRGLSARLAEARLKRAQLANEGAKTARRAALTLLKAPVAGTVQQVAVHTPGGVVTEAQVLMVIVPGDALVTAEVVVDNKDIGFVSAGQQAEIKLETFPFTKYGTVPARVAWVAADAVKDEKRGAVFTATVSLLERHIDVGGKRVGLAPGMNMVAEIKTGKRRIIEYLTDSIKGAASESMRER